MFSLLQRRAQYMYQIEFYSNHERVSLLKIVHDLQTGICAHNFHKPTEIERSEFMALTKWRNKKGHN